MSLEAGTPELAEERARNVYRQARAASLCATAATAVGLAVVAYYYGPGPLLAAVLAGVLLAFSPAGGPLTLFTLWAGRWVNSCPNCPAAHLERVEVHVRECDNCGKVEGEVTGVAGGGWSLKYEDGEAALEHCSLACVFASRGWDE